MAYVQTPPSSWFSQACDPEASGVVSGPMSDALMRVEPNSMPRMAPPDRMSSAGVPISSSLLSVVAIFSVFALEVLLYQAFGKTRRLGIERFRHESHARE